MKEILGVDPGFSSLGWSICTSIQGVVYADRCGVITTEKGGRKYAVRASEDNIHRAQVIYKELCDIIVDRGIKLICTETMSWPRNAGVVAKMGIAWGVIASVACRWGIPVVQASPVDIKKAVTGNGKASKEEMIAAIVSSYPQLALPTQLALQEHAADAVGAVIACRASELFKAVTQND
jgi:crossover junction endodeoxyribonuclease RuvC